MVRRGQNFRAKGRRNYGKISKKVFLWIFVFLYSAERDMKEIFIGWVWHCVLVRLISMGYQYVMHTDYWLSIWTTQPQQTQQYTELILTLIFLMEEKEEESQNWKCGIAIVIVGVVSILGVASFSAAYFGWSNIHQFLLLLSIRILRIRIRILRSFTKYDIPASYLWSLICKICKNIYKISQTINN